MGRLVRRYPVCRLHQESQPSLVASARMKQVGCILGRSKTFFCEKCRRVLICESGNVAFSPGLDARCVPGTLGWNGAVYREGIEFSVRDNLIASQGLDTSGAVGER